MSYPNVDILYLSEKDMIEAGVTDVLKCTDCMEEVVKLLDAGDYRMGGENGNSHGCQILFPDNPEFPNMPKNGPDRRFMAMPAYLGGKFDMAGVKWYGSNVDNRDKGLPRSILMVVLNDKETGAPVAFMSANLISSYRTAAIPGVGVKLLSKEDSKVIGAIGPGAIQATQVETFCALRPSIDTIKIKGRGKASIDRFISYVKEHCPNVKNYIICDSIEECVKDADIVTAAVSTPTGGHKNYPYIEKEWIKPGALITTVGALDFPDDLVTDPDTLLVVDNKKLYEAWADEYPYPTFDKMFLLGDKFTDLAHDGKLDWDSVVNIGAIAAGKVPGRKSDDQIILYSIGGMPVEDVAWGKTIYESALEKGIGTKLNLWDKPYIY
ncbi:MAG: tyramine oxidase subunit B [Oscillospiraceae bacterium]|nr:tyramine oxidase subunit B [Oscillospiraceae bacterium]MDD6084906.1 tyramine oxidase subunit B [Oscillospiraceae bacterium]MDY3257385.1 tyramine oxidase subunit B [Ruminococcus callidus]